MILTLFAAQMIVAATAATSKTPESPHTITPFITAVNVMLSGSISNSTREQEITQKLFDDNFTPESGIKVVVTLASTSVSSEYAAQVQLYLSTYDTSMDIFMLDVVWPGTFADYLMDLTPFITPEIAASHNKQIWDCDNVDGKHVAMPFFADYGIFYYRDDLLSKYGFQGPPATWDEMEKMAKKIIQSEDNMVGYVAQFNAYEGLTCNLMEWLESAGAGSVMTPNGTVTLDNPNTSRILKRVQNWLLTGITPKYALTYAENDALGKFESGGAVFMRNWPYAIEQMMAKNLPFTFKTTGLPGETNETNFPAALGGWHLGANGATKNLTATAETILFMASRDFQKARFLNFGLMPTVMSLYEDPDVCARIDCNLFGKLRVSPRPSAQSGTHYLDVSRVLYTHVNEFLSFSTSLDSTIADSILQIEQTMGTYSQIVASRASFIAINSPLGYIFLALSAFGIVVTLTLMGLTVANRKHPVIAASSPDFLCLIGVGVCIGFATVFVHIGSPTSSLCLAQPFMLTISFSVSFSALIVKTWRIFRIFNRASGKQGNIDNLKTPRLLVNVGAFVLVNLIILIVWAVVSPPSSQAVFQTSDSAYLSCVSPNSNIFNGILVAYNGLMLVLGTWLAYKTRNVDERFRESFWIAVIMYNTLIWSAISVTLVFVPSLGNDLHFAVRSVSILMCCYGIHALLFLPKFKEIYIPSLEPEDVLNKSSRKAAKQSPSQVSGNSTVAPGAAGVSVAFRYGRSSIFMSNWMAGKLTFCQLSCGMMVLIGIFKNGKGSKSTYGFTVGNDEAVEVLRSEKDKESWTVSLKLPDGTIYEFLSDDINHMLAVVESVSKKKSGKLQSSPTAQS